MIDLASGLVISTLYLHSYQLLGLPLLAEGAIDTQLSSHSRRQNGLESGPGVEDLERFCLEVQDEDLCVVGHVATVLTAAEDEDGVEIGEQEH